MKRALLIIFIVICIILVIAVIYFRPLCMTDIYPDLNADAILNIIGYIHDDKVPNRATALSVYLTDSSVNEVITLLTSHSYVQSVRNFIPDDRSAFGTAVWTLQITFDNHSTLSVFKCSDSVVMAINDSSFTYFNVDRNEEFESSVLDLLIQDLTIKFS